MLALETIAVEDLDAAAPPALIRAHALLLDDRRGLHAFVVEEAIARIEAVER